jgi:hypothetical protein
MHDRPRSTSDSGAALGGIGGRSRSRAGHESSGDGGGGGGGGAGGGGGGGGAAAAGGGSNSSSFVGLRAPLLSPGRLFDSDFVERLRELEAGGALGLSHPRGAAIPEEGGAARAGGLGADAAAAAAAGAAGAAGVAAATTHSDIEAPLLPEGYASDARKLKGGAGVGVGGGGGGGDNNHNNNNAENNDNTTNNNADPDDDDDAPVADEDVPKFGELIRQQPGDVIAYLENDALVPVAEFEADDALVLRALAGRAFLVVGRDHFDDDYEALWLEELARLAGGKEAARAAARAAAEEAEARELHRRAAAMYGAPPQQPPPPPSARPQQRSGGGGDGASAAAASGPGGGNGAYTDDERASLLGSAHGGSLFSGFSGGGGGAAAGAVLGDSGGGGGRSGVGGMAASAAAAASSPAALPHHPSSRPGGNNNNGASAAHLHHPSAPAMRDVAGSLAAAAPRDSAALAAAMARRAAAAAAKAAEKQQQQQQQPHDHQQREQQQQREGRQQQQPDHHPSSAAAHHTTAPSAAGRLNPSLGWTSSVRLEAYVVNVRDAAAEGHKGLLRPLLQRHKARGCPLAVFSLPAVQAVIEAKWEAWARRALRVELALYAAWIAAFTAFTLLLQREDPAASLAELSRSPSGLATLAASIWSAAASLPFVYMEACTVQAYGLGGWYSLINALDASTYALQFFITFLHVVRRGLATPWFHALVAAQTIGLWFKLQFYGRAFDPTRSVSIDTVHKVVMDLRWFLLFVALTLLGFGMAFYALYSGDRQVVAFSSLWHTLATMVSFMLMMFDYNDFYGSSVPVASVGFGDWWWGFAAGFLFFCFFAPKVVGAVGRCPPPLSLPAVALTRALSPPPPPRPTPKPTPNTKQQMLLFMFFSFVVCVMLFNLLIALMTSSFQRVSADTGGLRLALSRAEMVDELETTLPAWARAPPPRFLHVLRLHPQAQYSVDLSSVWSGIGSLERTLLGAERETSGRVEALERRAAALDAKLDVLLRLQLATVLGERHAAAAALAAAFGGGSVARTPLARAGSASMAFGGGGESSKEGQDGDGERRASGGGEQL